MIDISYHGRYIDIMIDISYHGRYIDIMIDDVCIMIDILVSCLIYQYHVHTDIYIYIGSMICISVL